MNLSSTKPKGAVLKSYHTNQQDRGGTWGEWRGWGGVTVYGERGSEGEREGGGGGSVRRLRRKGGKTSQYVGEVGVRCLDPLARTLEGARSAL